MGHVLQPPLRVFSLHCIFWRLEASSVCSNKEIASEAFRSIAASSNSCTSVYTSFGPVTAEFFLLPLQEATSFPLCHL